MRPGLTSWPTGGVITTSTRFTYADFLEDNGVRALINVIIHGAEREGPYGNLEVDSRTPMSLPTTSALCAANRFPALAFCGVPSVGSCLLS